MEFEQIIKLIDHISASKLTSFQYETEDLKLSMECGQVQTVVAAGVDMTAQAVAPVAAVPVQTVAASVAAENLAGNIVKSPLVGTFYAAPAEDAAPFVKVGDKVKKGQVLAIVEAMKLMNEIESDFDGEVAEIYVNNAEMVDFGKPLFRIV